MSFVTPNPLLQDTPRLSEHIFMFSFTGRNSKSIKEAPSTHNYNPQASQHRSLHSEGSPNPQKTYFTNVTAHPHRLTKMRLLALSAAMAIALPAAEPVEDLVARNCPGRGSGTLCPSGYFQVRVAESTARD